MAAGVVCRLSVLAGLLVAVSCGLEGCHAEQPWPLWEAYTRHFLDDQGRVIDRSAGDRTTSEGEAYAMFFALVDNDRRRFDKLLDWTQANLAGGDLTAHLPAWSWGRAASGEWKTLDDNSASDADLWMAYTLLEAGRMWREPRFESLGRLLAERIAKQEVVLVPGLGASLAPASAGFHPDPDRYILNPSYLPPPVLVYLAHTLPQGPWGSVLESLPGMLSPQVGHGFAMDWVAAGPDGVRAVAPPVEGSAGRREPRASGSYDAVRVYLWLGMSDPSTPGMQALVSELPGMAKALERGLTPPLEVDAGGNVLHADSPIGFSAAVIPYLEAVGAKAEAKTQEDRMAAMRDSETKLYGHPGEYYDQNLALFSTGWSEQRFRFESDGRLRVRWKQPREH